MKTQAKPRSKLLAELLAGIGPIPGDDCLEQKRLGQEGIRQELAGLGPDEVRAYCGGATRSCLPCKRKRGRSQGDVAARASKARHGVCSQQP